MPGGIDHPPGAIPEPSSHGTHLYPGIYERNTNLGGPGSLPGDIQTTGVDAQKFRQSLRDCITNRVSTVEGGSGNTLCQVVEAFVEGWAQRADETGFPGDAVGLPCLEPPTHMEGRLLRPE